VGYLRDEEAQVREEKDASVFVDGVEDGNRLRLLVVRVDLWRTPQLFDLETHVVGRSDRIVAGLEVGRD
jgi:hypothetical protein